MRKLVTTIACLLAAECFAAVYDDWQHSGSLFLLTTPDGADLPPEAMAREFPVLIRLHADSFPFAEAEPHGADLRVTSADGTPLPYQVESWNAAGGEAAVWVRVPVIKGNERQQLKLFWGNPDAKDASDGRMVFGDANGYVAVWHMGDPVRDEAGGLPSESKGTAATTGVIGEGRHFPGGAGVFCGNNLTNLPTGAGPHSTEAWFRALKPNATLLGWGNEQAQGKVVLQYGSPPRIRADCYFSGGDVASESRLMPGEWTHVVHTFEAGEARIYINGRLDGSNARAGSSMAIKSPARLWLGGWYNNYDFMGDLDEVRLSRVVRSAEWVRLQYENQRPLQTLVGPVVRTGNAFSVSTVTLDLREGQQARVTAEAGGAQKVYWSVIRDGVEHVVAVDRFAFTFDAGRVMGDATATLRFRAVCADGVKTRDIAILIREDIPEPQFTLSAAATWDGRQALEIVPQINNLAAMQAKRAGEIETDWSVGPFAVVKEVAPDRLRLLSAQNSGRMTVTATLRNGGRAVTRSTEITVTEPERDAWVHRQPEKHEKPQEGQFYARDDRYEGTLFYNGSLAAPADSIFLRLYADNRLVTTETAKPAADGAYALTVKLVPGLVVYRVEFGVKAGDRETVLDRVGDLVCGDAYLIDGQSNALATDTPATAPPETSPWIRSYGSPPPNPRGDQGNLWCRPVWRARAGEQAELGWWGMELAKRLVESRKLPVFIINGAVGGTRIDQHQRNDADPSDLGTIYGRMLWRARQARITHGIRGIIWHQGENDQGADGPTGGYGWETYQPLFVEMAGGWKRDFPNVQHYYVFQIWPNACAMGGRDGSGDRLRERQRTLPRLFSKMSIMSTLGVRPPGGCHYPLEGWAEFARLLQPLIERDHHGQVPLASITPPNLVRATRAAADAIALEFDQPVEWNDSLVGQFYPDGEPGRIAAGSVSGNTLTLRLKEPRAAMRITYLKEASWNPDTLLLGTNGLAALTFCEVPIEATPAP
jgi:hypothetical protein